MFNLPYNKFHKTLEIVTFILMLAQIVYTAVLYPQLPSKIPSHFNLEGEEGTNERTAVMNGTRLIEKDCYIKPKKAWRLLKTADEDRKSVV